MIRRTFMGLALGTALALGGSGIALAQSAAEQAGFAPDRLAKITETLKADIAKGTLPGAVVLIQRKGKAAYFESVGMIDPQTKAAMPKDGIFRIYSMTKPLTSVAAMMLVEEGKMQLSDPVAKYLPVMKELQVGAEKPGADGKPMLETAPAKRTMTVQDLLRHTSGLTYGFFGNSLVKKSYASLFEGEFDNTEHVARLAKLPLHYEPGTIWDYSHSTDVLGAVVEKVSGKPLDVFFKERITGPLGMKDTAFFVANANDHSRVVEPFANDRSLGGGIEFFDPRQPTKWFSGGGGLMGTAADYARFLQMMLNGGSLDGKRYLSPQTVRYMTTDHMGSVIKPGPLYLPGAGYGFGLGFAVRLSDGVVPYAGSEGDYYWGGAGGTYFWVDPKQDMFVVFMMQSPKQRVYYRSLIRDMVYAALVK
ncbi:MAG: beta-lactamase family protein [Alphaproteobacteria bacterium]|nr:beta-lactamase family protein [Alphaproteobacteria bacterium]